MSKDFTFKEPKNDENIKPKCDFKRLKFEVCGMEGTQVLIRLMLSIFSTTKNFL